MGFHLLIIILIYYGLPNFFRYRSEFLPPLPVEIINISKSFSVDARVIGRVEKSASKKLTIDSATLMNKVFEVIEANRMFSYDLEKYKILIQFKIYPRQTI